MAQPSWRQIKRVMVPERDGSLWTPALDYITPGKLYRIVVEARLFGPAADSDPPAASDPGAPPPASAPAPPATDQHWTPESGTECTADGDPALQRSGSLTLDSCAPGALIAKIGGSTADLKPDKDRLLLFSVGRHCVFSVPVAPVQASAPVAVQPAQTWPAPAPVASQPAQTGPVPAPVDPSKVGSLYLGMNDTKDTRKNVKGQLEVTIFEAL